jgi:ring-1,2-phenylacetyl-CoA epoxidase subunit PaaE
MHHFHSLKAIKVQPETNDSVHISLEIPESLRHEFQFQQGQYLNVRFLLGGEDLRRSYSIVNAPYEGNSTLDILVKKLDQGIVSTYLNQQLKEGESIEVLSPQGYFYTNFHPSNQKTYVGLAAGSGISPVLSNLKEALHQEPNSKAFLFFSNKSLKEVIFKNQIEVVEKTKMEVFDLLKQSLRPEFINRIDEIVLFQPLNKKELGKIVQFQLQGFNTMLAKKGIILTATEDALHYLMEKGYNPSFGARPLKRVLQQEVLNPLSKEILAGKVKDNDRIVLDYFEKTGLVFSPME